MKTQRLIVTLGGWILALSVTLWFGVFHRSSPSPTAEEPQKNEGLPKSNLVAELLVGKWKLVRGTPGRPKEPNAITEFTKDGKVTISIGSNPTEDTVQTGFYHLEGKTLWTRLDFPRSESYAHTIAIELITENKLVIVDWGNPDERQVDEYERVREEPQRR